MTNGAAGQEGVVEAVVGGVLLVALPCSAVGSVGVAPDVEGVLVRVKSDTSRFRGERREAYEVG